MDAALELTVSGIKRIADAGPRPSRAEHGPLQVKSLPGHREIADSCMRRLRALLPDRKFVGRQVLRLLFGCGTLSSRLASAPRALGCRTDIVDTDLPMVITAAEAGYRTYPTAAEALCSSAPFLSAA